MIYLFSSFAGVYVFDEQFSVIKEKPLDTQQEFSSVLLPIEKQMIDQYIQSHEVVVIGEKKEQYRNVKFTQDPLVVNRALKAARHHFDMFCTKNIAITRTQLSSSLTRDLLLIQSIDAIAELEKTINLLS